MITCPICKHTEFEYFFEAAGLPVHCNILWQTREEALSAPRGDIALAYCLNCGHIFNTTVEPDLLAYGTSYDNTQTYSPTFRQYLNNLAAQLIAHYNLHNRTILEIGSGRGDFLKLLVELGDNHGVGFDPSYLPSEETAHPQITFIRDYYSANYSSIAADFMVMRHVLEHLPDPRGFVAGLRRLLDVRHAALYAEVPHGDYMLRTGGCWEVIYEHCGYFTRLSLLTLFTRAGFTVLELTQRFDGQFLSVEALPAAAEQSAFLPDKQQVAHALRDEIKVFKAHYPQQVARWHERLSAHRAAGERVVLWGAGSKGVAFCNLLQVKDEIAALVDINPRKHGKFIGGTGQRVIAPAALREIQPDVVIVGNRAYTAEIRAQLARLELYPKLVQLTVFG